MLRILLVILVALAVIIGLMKVTAGKSEESAAPEATAPAVEAPSAETEAADTGTVDDTAAAVEPQTDVYGETTAESGEAETTDSVEPLPAELSEGETAPADTTEGDEAVQPEQPQN